MITNSYKTNPNSNTAQAVAGLLPNEPGIEFFGIRETKTVRWIHKGKSYRFNELSGEHYMILWRQYQKDRGAQAFINNALDNLERQVELYAYYMWGDLDDTPDLLNGTLNFDENFRDHRFCPSRNFDFKYFNVGPEKLTLREINIIDFIKEDLPDKVIASSLENRNGEIGISMGTYDHHTKNLRNKLGVSSKVGVVMAAINAGI